MESQHEDLCNDVASNDQGLQTKRNGEPSQGLMMVVRECRGHHEVAMEPALDLCRRIILSYWLAGAFHWKQCDSVADCGQKQYQSPVGVWDPSIIIHLLADGGWCEGLLHKSNVP